jgi:hypothetical protein
MSEELRPEDFAKKEVVYRIPGMDSMSVRRDVEFPAADGDILTMDLYSPRDVKPGAKLSAVVFVAGYPDPGFERMLGRKFKETGSSVSWARLAAASGLAAITYTNREPAADLDALLRFVRQNAPSLGIDEKKIGLWASSGNVPVALSALMREGQDGLACAVLLYGIMLDLDGSTGVAEAARTFKFANPCAGRSVEDLPPELPLFIARAGQDKTPHVNESIDRFVAGALRLNLPMTLVNHREGPHAFDLFENSEASREVIQRILAFLRFHLPG